MTQWIAAIVTTLLVSVPGIVSAQITCDAKPVGPERTDCYIGLSRIYQGQSELAAGKARVQSDTASYRATTGSLPRAKPHRRWRGS